MKLLIAFAVLLILANSAFAADSYVCIPDKAVGFYFNRATNEWDFARFSVTGKKYLLKNGPIGWKWTDFGDSSPFGGEQCDAPNDAGFIDCGGYADIRVNTKSLRFQSIYPFGYIGNPIKGVTEGSDTPNIEIGTCAVL